MRGRMAPSIAPAPTPLARQLADGGRPGRPGALDAFQVARRAFLKGQRIEMQALAAELGTSRVTLHRWVGSRDLLLAEINWSMANMALAHAREQTTSQGGAGVAETIERFLNLVLDAPYIRSFVSREPEIALRILTTQRSPFQARLVSAVETMLREETDAGRLDPPMELDDLAYVVVRLAESFCWADFIVSEVPDPHKARLAIAALLR